MATTTSSCVIGIDVGGTNTDAVILRGNEVLAWHKTPTTYNIQEGVEEAIQTVLDKANLPSTKIDVVKIGTTQFVNAVGERNSNKLDKVAVIRLCGPYTYSTPPFVDFPKELRKLIEGHFGYVDGGYQVDGRPIAQLNTEQLKEQAAIIREKDIKSIVVIGVYSPSDPNQEEEARKILAAELGESFDISCSHTVGKLGFLERENSSILNASLRRFARHVIAGFERAVQKLGRSKLFITLNDGTLSKSSAAAECPVRCFSSGPTNSARGAALLADWENMSSADDSEVLVVDVGGTTTDICALLESGYPRQSAAFVKIAGVRTNFTIPDVHSIAIGGGSRVRMKEDGTATVGPDSVGAALEKEAISFGGSELTTTDLVSDNEKTQGVVTTAQKFEGLKEVSRAIEAAIDQVKTKKGDARILLVGGGSIIIDEKIAGVKEIIRPQYYEVANAVGAAIGKISGTLDTVVIPGKKTIDEEVEAAKEHATDQCVAAGGDRSTVEVVEVEILPINYVTNGATRLIVRVVGDLVFQPEAEAQSESRELSPEPPIIDDFSSGEQYDRTNLELEAMDQKSKATSYAVQESVDLEAYRPRIEGNTWYLSELDLSFLLDGTGVLGVGSCGEPYPSYLATLLVLRSGGELRILKHDSIADDAVIVSSGFIGSPSVYLERIPGSHEVTDAVKGVLQAAGHAECDAVVPAEIGGLNAFEAMLCANRLNKPLLDTDTVARAYPMVWQTVRCLLKHPVTPSAVANGCGTTTIFPGPLDYVEVENQMRDASIEQGSLAGMSVKPMTGVEAKTMPPNSYSNAWMIGRQIAMARKAKTDIVEALLQEQAGVHLFSGKITSVDRKVTEGFTRGSVILEQVSTDGSKSSATRKSVLVEFENENLSVTERTENEPDKIVACCPDLITFLDMANGAPLGISDYKYGLRVHVIALKSPPMWTTKEGLEMGGPPAFGLDVDYEVVSRNVGKYEVPRSLFEIYPSA